MKKIIFLFLSVLFYQSNVTAQNPINVVITGECSNVSGTYFFNGLVNGKNNYTQTFVFGADTVVIGVGFDGVNWVLYANGDITDDGFSNIAVPATMLPPFTGWVNTGCLDGTMTISENLSNDSFELNNNVVLYPNPADRFVTIQNSENSTKKFEYTIFDLTGRKVKSGNAKYNDQLDVTSLTSGQYMIQVETDNGARLVKKLVKK